MNEICKTCPDEDCKAQGFGHMDMMAPICKAATQFAKEYVSENWADCKEWLYDSKKEARREVESPSHYTSGGIEAKDALASAMSGIVQPPMMAYWWGCAFKYLWRWPRKNGIEDLRKCRQCLDFLIEEVDK